MEESTNGNFAKILDFFGSRSAFADALGVTKGAVSQWEAEGYVPGGRAVEIEMLSEGAIKAVDIANNLK